MPRYVGGVSVSLPTGIEQKIRHQHPEPVTQAFYMQLLKGLHEEAILPGIRQLLSRHPAIVLDSLHKSPTVQVTAVTLNLDGQVAGGVWIWNKHGEQL